MACCDPEDEPSHHSHGSCLANHKYHCPIPFIELSRTQNIPQTDIGNYGNYIDFYTYMHACMHACIHTYLHVYIPIYRHYMYIYIYICTCMYIYIYTHATKHLADFEPGSFQCQQDAKTKSPQRPPRKTARMQTMAISAARLLEMDCQNRHFV